MIAVDLADFSRGRADVLDVFARDGASRWMTLSITRPSEPLSKRTPAAWKGRDHAPFGDRNYVNHRCTRPPTRENVTCHSLDEDG